MTPSDVVSPTSQGRRAGPALRLLVLAPAFPSVTQAWLDSTLVLLLRSGIDLHVVTMQARAGVRHPDVDQYDLLKRTSSMAGAPVLVLLRLLFRAMWRPLWAASSLRRVLSALLSRRPRSTAGGILWAAAADAMLDMLPNPSAVHAHSMWMAWIFLPSLRLRRIPLIVTFHGHEPAGVSGLGAPLQTEILDAATLVLVNTEAALSQLRLLGFSGKHVAIIPQPIPVEHFPYRPKPSPRAGETLHLFTVGRLHRDKGQAYALLALARLRRNGVLAHWHFAGVGPAAGRLRVMVERLGLGTCVTFHGALTRDALVALHSKCHIHVLPSLAASRPTEWSETQGVANLEAQASGCIVVSTRTGGIPESIDHEMGGLLVGQRSHREIADAIHRLLEDSNLWSQLQDGARAAVSSRFSPEAVGNRLVPELVEVMGGHRQ